MRTRIQKWGNSLALRIPKSFAAETRLEQDSLVDLTIQGGQLVVTPVVPDYSLDDLLARVTPENLHAEQEVGESAGQEAW